MKRLEIWFPVALMLSLAALTYWLDHSVQSAPPKQDGSTRHDPDYIVENFKTTRMGTDGTPHNVLTATKMTHYPDDDSTYLEQPHFTRYKTGTPSVHITGKHGMVSANGEHVSSARHSEFSWNAQLSQSWSPSFTRICAQVNASKPPA